MSSTTLPVCPKTGSTSPSLTVHLCLHTAPGNRECALRDGNLIAVDSGRTDPLDGKLFAVRTGAGLVVKRLRRQPGGRWLLTSDNPAHASRPVAEDDRILGQVAWCGPQNRRDG